MAAPLELALKPAAKYALLLVERVYSVSRLLDGNEELNQARVVALSKLILSDKRVEACFSCASHDT